MPLQCNTTTYIAHPSKKQLASIIVSYRLRTSFCTTIMQTKPYRSSIQHSDKNHPSSAAPKQHSSSHHSTDIIMSHSSCNCDKRQYNQPCFSHHYSKQQFSHCKLTIIITTLFCISSIPHYPISQVMRPR